MNPKNPYWSPLCATEDLSGQEFFQVQLPIPAVNPSTCARMPFRGVTPAPSDGPQPTLVPPYAQGVLSSPYWTASMPKHGGQRQRSGAVGGVHTCTLAFSDSLVKMSQVHEMRRGKAATALSSRMSALSMDTAATANNGKGRGVAYPGRKLAFFRCFHTFIKNTRVARGGGAAA